MLTKLDRLKGYSARESCVALLSMLAILLFASAIADAQTIVVSQQLWGANETNSAAPFENQTVSTSGGNWGPASPGGHSAAVNTFGTFVTGTSTGGFVEQFTNLTTPNQNAVMTVVGQSNILPGGIAIDHNNYLYISGESSNVIYKMPVNVTANANYADYGVGTYGPINSTCPNSSPCAFLGPNGSTTPPPACAGVGQAPDINGICQINLGNGNYGFNIASIAVDSNHNLFFTTDGSTVGSGAPTLGNAPYSVFECNTACLYPTGGATPKPVLIYTEPAGSGGQLYTGAIAVDQNDNVYFTDSFISNSGTTAGYSTSSDLYQVTYNSTTKAYGTPRLLWTLTPACAAPATGTPCTDAITTVATDAAGNVYFGTELDGVFEIANNGTALAGNPPVIPLSGEGVKTVVPDGNGNFYFVGNNPATMDDTAGFLAIGSVVDTAQAWSAEPAGGGSVSNVSAVDADAGGTCPAPSKLTFAQNSTNYGFSGAVTTGSSCSALPFASGLSFPVTITLKPTSATATGLFNTTMTATNSADAHTGTFAVSGEGAATQTITVTAPATLSPKCGAAPVAMEATATSGLPVVFTTPAETTTPPVCTVAGGIVTFTNNGSCPVDANQPGNSAFAPAPQKVTTFTVSALTQRLTTLTPLTVTFTPTPIPLLAASSDDTANAPPVCFSYGSGNGTVSGQATATDPLCVPPQFLTLTGTGPIGITVFQNASACFAGNSANPTITVNPASQNIVFTTPSGTLPTAPANLVYGASLTLAATGGASGNPVKFTIDPLSTGYVAPTPASGTTPAIPASSTAGTLSNSGVVTATGLGTLVIDANQAASDATSDPEYAAATPVQAFLNVVTISLTTNPVIGPANGTTMYTSGSLNVVTITDAIPGAAIYYTTNGSAPTLSSTPYTAPIALTATGSATINAIAIAPGYALSGVATATYTVSATAANFTTAVAPSTVTVSPSEPGIVDITVTSQFGFNSATTFTCSTVPSNLSCSFNPATVTPAVGQNASTALTLTESSSAAFQRRSNPFLPEGATFAIAACFLLGWKKRRALFLALVLIAGVIAVTQLNGCGGSSSAAPTTSSVVVTATSGKLTQTITLQVTVNP
jgi:hypothetical protein